jgi:Rod binding domain-containing protein
MDGIEPIDVPPMLPSIEPAASIASRKALDARHGIREASGEISPAEHSDEQKKQIAKDFESVLLTKLFEQVQESTGSWGLDEEDGTSQQVQGLFWFFLARDVADKGGFGLWKDLYRQFQQMEGAGDPGEGISEEL